jgi:hypothetical protein
MTARVRGTAAALVSLLLVNAVRGAVDDLVDQAVSRGVAYIRSQQTREGTWQQSQHAQIGATALNGLTLVECGVAADDAAVQRALAAVRRECVPEIRTYSLSLAIMFLDRLGDPADEPLIVSMALRLLAGQATNGGWTYECPKPQDDEVRRLSEQAGRRSELRTKPAPPSATPSRRQTADLPAEVQNRLRQILEQPLRESPIADNSNTQFAILALWIARRHGVPVEAALARVEQRFRQSQSPNGGWSYMLQGVPTPSMTCAGLLGLATAHGLANEVYLRSRNLPKNSAAARKLRPPAPPNKDAAIRAALFYLGTIIGVPVKNLPPDFRTAEPLVFPNTQDSYYFLWSLERVGVAYGLKTIAHKDWYAWGAQLVLASQQPDGSWKSRYPEACADTCFALLFLRRSNLASDLTSALRGKVADPGERTLHAGRPSEAAGSENTSSPEASQLADQLVQAPADQQPGLIAKLKDSPGPVHTEALAQAAAQLSGTMRTQARDALAERLSRMKNTTLRDYLKDNGAEIRRASAVAAAMKDDKSLIPSIIPLLEDAERSVELAAHVALKTLSGVDLGPANSATASEKAEAVTRWKEWWEKRAGNGKQEP